MGQMVLGASSSSWRRVKASIITKMKSKNYALYDPRGIIEEGKLRDVQCRSPPLRTLILERRFSSQGKYEEERKIRRDWREELDLFMGNGRAVRKV